MPDAPILVAAAAPERRYASRPARALSGLGFVLLALVALVSAAWTALFVAVVLMSVHNRTRFRSSRWELDAPGPEARLRFGRDARESVLLARVDGVLVQHLPGATSRGIPVTRDHERWWFVDASGSVIGAASTEALDPAAVAAIGRAIAVPLVPLGVARRLGQLPSGLPWHVRHPGLVGTVVVAASFALLIALLAVPPYWG